MAGGGLAGLARRVPSPAARAGAIVAVGGCLAVAAVGWILGSVVISVVGLIAGVGCTVAYLAIELARTRHALRMVSTRGERLSSRVESLEGRLARLPSHTQIEHMLSANVAHGERQTAALESEVKQIHTSIQQTQADIKSLGRNAQRLALALYEVAGDSATWQEQRENPLRVLVASELIDSGHLLDGYRLAGESGCLDELGVGRLRRMRTGLRNRGYLRAAHRVAECIARLSDAARDEVARNHLRGEMAVLRGVHIPSVHVGRRLERSKPGRILYLVGSALPDKQSGYTIRTHRSALALREQGFDVHIVTQLGWGTEEPGAPLTHELDGVPYHRLVGPLRGSVPLDRWLDEHVNAVFELVADLEPEILQAASDFLNALTATTIGRTCGLPVIYESRGFWEETWLSRQARRYGWNDIDRLTETHGLPDVYVWRKRIEDKYRRSAAAVVTLDPVMASRIEDGGVAPDKITVVPNAVDPDEFPLIDRDGPLATALGFPPDMIVIGYVSSLVEYEGVDTLVDAVGHLQEEHPDFPIGLLIVGDGPVRAELEAQATSIRLKHAVFTGQVPHSEVLKYYSVIDIFVVPRRPVDVCHLVTPLKPFEAFATGRTVVLSDVRALASIAHQSEAAVLFEAGSVEGLAAEIWNLLCDPPRREALAIAGAEWVRSHRTWKDNATLYRGLYEELGAHPRSTLGARPASGPDLSGILDELGRRTPRPLEHIGGSRSTGERVRLSGWKLGERPPVLVEPEVDWTTLCTEDRTWNFQLHAWDFMEPVLREYEEDARVESLTWCIERGLAWAQTFADGDSHGTMAWYDMAVGLRSYRLAYLVEQALLQGSWSRTDLEILVDTLEAHQEELLTDRVFKRNNHGVYVALGGLALARRFPMLRGMADLERVSRERLAIMATQQFASDGGHVEHSPDYHRMLLETFSSAIRDGLVHDPELQDRLARAEDVLGWFVQPNGELLPLGDSFGRVMHTRADSVQDPRSQFQLSGGELGKRDRRTYIALPDAGFAAVRSPQPTGPEDYSSSSYLSLAAGFHSRTHKHADDLSITWFDHKQEILIDAGRYGYVDLLPADSPLRTQGFYYGAPERQYVESTRAHNTVEADGRDHERRSRKPYGSALETIEEKAGHYRLTACVDHGGWTHARTVVLSPGRWLRVTDHVTAQDGQPHDFRAWWNLADELDLLSVGKSGLRFQLCGSDGQLRIHELSGAALIEPKCGGTDPLRGWRSKHDLEFTPAWSVGFEVLGVPQHRFDAIFLLSDTNALPPRHPFEDDEPK